MSKTNDKKQICDSWIKSIWTGRKNTAQVLAEIFASYITDLSIYKNGKQAKSLLRFCVNTNDSPILLIPENFTKWEWDYFKSDTNSVAMELEKTVKKIKPIGEKKIMLNDAAFFRLLTKENEQFFVSTDIYITINDNWNYLKLCDATYRLLSILTRQHKDWKNNTPTQIKLLFVLFLFKRADTLFKRGTR